MKRIVVGIVILLGVVLIVLGGIKLADMLQPLHIQKIGLHYLPQNRLRLKVDVQLNKSADARIKYWPLGGKDTLYTETSADEVKHTLVMYNLIAAKKYKYQVEVFKGREKYSSKVYPFQTKSIYQTTPYLTLDSLDASSSDLEDKYFLTQILTQPGAAVIMNGSGEMVWYEPFAKGVKVSNWTRDKTVLCILGSEDIPSSGGDEIVEINLKGEYVRHLKLGEGGMDKMVHHEVRKDASGNIYSITFDKKVVDLSSVGGLKNDTVKADGIVVFDPKGTKVWEWSFLDHIDILTYPNILKNKKDLVHANSLFDDGKGSFLMSFRDLNQVWKIDRKTGKVIWKFGENGDFQLDKAHYFSAQHWAHINKNGELQLLDNGTKNKQSRTLSFILNEDEKTAQSRIVIPYPKEIHSSVKGNSTLLDKDRMLVCLTDPRLFLITDLAGKLLWKVSIGGDPYRIEVIEGFKNVAHD